MEDLVKPFSQPGALVFDIFSCTFATAKICLQLPWHRCFEGCEFALECFTASTEALVATNSSQVLNNESDISSTAQVMDACKIVVRALDGL